jgi:hypothetical protein
MALMLLPPIRAHSLAGQSAAVAAIVHPKLCETDKEELALSTVGLILPKPQFLIPDSDSNHQIVPAILLPVCLAQIAAKVAQ